jgi:hypothetical protein
MSLPGGEAMNFKKLSKEKRKNLILVAVLTMVALGGIGFGLIRYQYVQLRVIATETSDAGKKLARMKETIQHSEEIARRLAEASETLAAHEAEMGTGDLYSWGLDVLRRFRAAYKVEVPAVNQPVLGECTLLPKFPYKQATFTIGGSAYYHDLGTFIADFENQFPHMRIVNLSLNPISNLIATEKEKLAFKMDIVTLVRPNQN